MIGRRRGRSGRNERPRGRTRCKTKSRETKNGGEGGMMKRVEEETEGREDGTFGRKGGRKNGRKVLMGGRSTGK